MPEKIGLEAALDMRAFNKGLKLYTKSLGKMGKFTVGIAGKMGKAFAGVAKIVGKTMVAGVALGTTAIAGLGAGMAKLAVDAAPLQGIKAAFEGIMEASGVSADVMLASFKASSAGMLTNKEIMESYNLAAMLVSETFAETLPKAMKYVGKVSLATGEDQGYMLDSLVRGVGRLSPMILDNLGIQVDLTKAYEDFAEEQGVVVEEMTKAQQQTALMTQVMALLEKKTAAMPEVTGTAAAAMGSLKAQLQDTKDAIGLALLPTFTEIMGKVSAFASENLPMLVGVFEQRVIPAISQLVGKVGWIIDAFRDAGIVSSEFEEALSSIVGEKTARIFVDMADTVSQFIQRIPEAARVASTFWKETLQPALKVVRDFVRDQVVPRFKDACDWLKTKIPEAVAVASKFWKETLKPALKVVWDYLEENIFPAFTTARGWLKDKIPEAVETARKWWEETLKGALQTVRDYLIDEIFPKFTTTYSWLRERIPEAVEVVRKWWEETFKDALKTVRDYIVDEVVPKFKELAKLFEERFKEATEEISRIWEETLKPALKIVRDYVKDQVIPAFGDVVELFRKDLKFETVNTSNLWKDTLKPALEEVWSVVAQDIIPIFDAVAELQGTYWAKRIEWQTALWGKFHDKLKDDVNPIVKEAARILEERLSRQVQWLSDRLGDLWEALRKVWKIISEKVTKAIKKLTERLEKLKPPGWLTGHSLSPFELTLAGINKELANLASFSIPRVRAAMASLGAGLGGTAAIPVAVTSEVMHRVSAPALFQRPAMTMPVSSSSTVNVNMGGVNIYDQMGAAVFEARVRQIMASSVGG